MRPIWSGSISFGLVNIPVNLYSGTIDHPFKLDMLHKKDLSPIRYAKICKNEEKEIPYEEIVKGYEYQKGEYILISPEDLNKLYPQKSSTIDIEGFVDEKEVDSIYFEKPYFLEPGKGASKAYTLLREALKKSKKVGIATFVLHNRGHVALLKAHNRSILLQQLRYLNEIKDLGGLELPVASKINEAEVEMALKLIEQLETTFKPEKYKDTYKEEFKTMIDNKLKGKEVYPVAAEKTERPELKDIMSRLKASLEKYKEPKNEKKESKTKVSKRTTTTKKSKAYASKS